MVLYRTELNLAWPSWISFWNETFVTTTHIVELRHAKYLILRYFDDTLNLEFSMSVFNDLQCSDYMSRICSFIVLAPPEGKKSSTGAIVGGVIGGILFLVLIGIAVFFFLRWKSKWRFMFLSMEKVVWRSKTTFFHSLAEYFLWKDRFPTSEIAICWRILQPDSVLKIYESLETSISLEIFTKLYLRKCLKCILWKSETIFFVLGFV